MTVEKLIGNFDISNLLGMVWTCNSFIDPLLYVNRFHGTQQNDSFTEYVDVELQKFWKDSLLE
jgi:hypothetical protein